MDKEPPELGLESSLVPSHRLFTIRCVCRTLKGQKVEGRAWQCAQPEEGGNAGKEWGGPEYGGRVTVRGPFAGLSTPQRSSASGEEPCSISPWGGEVAGKGDDVSIACPGRAAERLGPRGAQHTNGSAQVGV